MKFSYKFSNLVGTIYKNGDILFSADGNSVICPVGNKISMYDLVNNRAQTLPVEARFNYKSLALSPNGKLLLASDEDGELHIINLYYKSIMYRKRFSEQITCIKFSPNGKHYALARENKVFIYSSPGFNQRVFDPFLLERYFVESKGDVSCMDWSFESKVMAFGSDEVHIYPLNQCKTFYHYVIGSRTPLVGVFFKKESLNLLTVNQKGHVCQWECSMKLEELVFKEAKQKKVKVNFEDSQNGLERLEIQEENCTTVSKSGDNPIQSSEDGKFFYKRINILYLDQHVKNHWVTVKSASYSAKTQLLVTGLSNGDFYLIDTTDKGDIVHSLNISKEEVNRCCLNPSGDWLALGVSSLGQLVVWEWQSETYILKQQSHFNNIRVICYSPDGSNIVSGGSDGKVKLWSCQSSICLVTFSEHQGPITAIVFTQSGKAILSSSLDGTVRAFDTMRYRNFKTLTSPVPAQFSCLSVDSSGELVAAGATDVHEIYLWSLKTGRLLEILAGHTGPVSSLQFSPQPASSRLVSTAWDKTVKVWDAIAVTTAKESFEIGADGICVAIRPDGEQLAVAIMNGHIVMINPETGKQEACIEGRDDLGAGRADADKITAKSNLKSKSFTTICYSADGKFILAAGLSKHVCIYSIEDELLIKKFEITQNRSFDAMDEIINRRKMAENEINTNLIEDRDDLTERKKLKLPGVVQGDNSQRAFKPEISVDDIKFSPTGRNFAACSSEGLLIYSLDNDWLFDPLQLEEGNTPHAVRLKLEQKKYSTALMMACRLNVDNLCQEVVEQIPINSIPVVVTNLPQFYVESLLKLISSILEKTRHLGLYMNWVVLLLKSHGQTLKSRSSHILTILSHLQKVVITQNSNLGKVCNHNEYMLKYLLAQAVLSNKKSGSKPLMPSIKSENNIDIKEQTIDEDLGDFFDDTMDFS